MDQTNSLFASSQDTLGNTHRQADDVDEKIETAPAHSIGEVIEVHGRQCVCSFADSVRQAVDDTGGERGQMIGQIGSFLKISIGDREVFCVVRNLRSVGMSIDQTIFAELDFIGELTPTAAGQSGKVFRRGVTKYPMPGQKIYVATGQDMRTIFAPTTKASANIGYIYPTDSVKASIDIDAVLSRHLAVLGSTGTGKSTVVSLLLQKVVEQSPNGHVLIFDPHDEYSKAFPHNGVRHDTSKLALPFWLMNLEEHIEVLVAASSHDRETDIDILKRVLVAARRKGKPSNVASRITADSPVPYMFADFISEIQSNMGKLEKPEKVAPYMRLKSKLEELRSDSRYSFMFSGLVVNDDFSETLSDLFRMPANGKPVSILDLSGVPSDIVNVVVSVISRIAFDFARIARDRDECRPLLLVCEEAHRYVPEAPVWHKAVKRILDKIAKEGRKYGVGLCLVTQRPSDISESILSQCGTMLSLRLNNERDQKFVEKSIPDGAEGFLNVLPSLRNRECLLVGEGIAAPSRVMIYDVAPDLLPNSNDPSFADIWTGGDASDNFVADIVEAWRGDEQPSITRG
jgi:hypothetical protein